MKQAVDDSTEVKIAVLGEAGVGKSGEQDYIHAVIIRIILGTAWYLPLLCTVLPPYSTSGTANDGSIPASLRPHAGGRISQGHRSRRRSLPVAHL